MDERFLEREISDLEQLSAIREQCAEWRDQGRAALIRFLTRDTSKKDAEEWEPVEEFRDKALMIKALSYPQVDRALLAGQVKTLQALHAGEIVGNGRASTLFEEISDSLPYYHGARALSALSGAPHGAFSSASMYFYYLVVRELYYATGPSWSVGGARGGPGGSPSAVVTSECVRAVRTFARTLARTGEYARVLADLEYMNDQPCPAWVQYDQERRNLSLQISLEQRSWNLALALENPIPAKISDGTSTDSVRKRLIKALRNALEAFSTAHDGIVAFREDEERAGTTEVKRRLLDRSGAAHSIALGAIKDAVARAEAACELFRVEDDAKPLTDPDQRRACSQRLRKLHDHFKEAQIRVEKLVVPAVNYLSTVLDHELAKPEARKGVAVPFDAAEMAASAASCGAVMGWEDERLLMAATYLAAAVSDQGFPVGQPYHVGRNTYNVPSQLQTLTSFAQLVENVKAFDVPLTAFTRMKRYFIRNRHEIEPGVATWRWEHSSPDTNSASFTALAVVALDHLARALDARINDAVLWHFNHTRPRDLKLHHLFYPDYGLACSIDPGTQRAYRARSIALDLERMRAHVAGVVIDRTQPDPLYSIVLHGPPGTGKTTLIEALAASAEVPLVEVTPSDIFVRGTDGLEARAGAVLKALSLLTNVVILFDEFDPVLAARAGGGNTSIFTFLTAGMLPKLKKLYESAKRRRIAYALVTNLLDKIDPAAIRAGRFDAMVGIYPPDLLSRYGRLQAELRAYETDCAKVESIEVQTRVSEVVARTAGGSMQELAKRGWFTRPKDQLKAGTAFAYILGGPNPPAFEPPRTEPWVPNESSDTDWRVIMSWENPAMTVAPVWHGTIAQTTQAFAKPPFTSMVPAKELYFSLTKLRDITNKLSVRHPEAK